MEPIVAHLPDGLTREEFGRIYREHLERHRQAFVEHLRSVLVRTDFTSPVEDVEIGVFPDASGDGHISVWCYLNGPNRRVSRTEPSLFAGKSIGLTDGLRVPLHDPHAYDFDTADATVARR